MVGGELRADAQKNNDKLVKVAREHLSSRGVDTSLEAIAKDAGVGVGTLYRHFPDRDHLIFAALKSQNEDLKSTAEEIRSSSSTAEDLELWLQEVVRYLSSYQGLPMSIAQALEAAGKTPLAISCQQIIAITDEVLSAAQREGQIREGVSGRDLFNSALMIAWLGSQYVLSDELDRIRNIMRHGYYI